MNNSIKTLTLPVKGMTCAACVASVEKSLKSGKGVLKAQVNYATSTVSLELSEQASLKQLSKNVKSKGYELVTKEDSSQNDTVLKSMRIQLFITIPLAALVMVLSMFIGPFEYKNLLLLVLTTVVLGVGGIKFYKSALRQLKHGSANMDTLIFFGTGSAYIFSCINTFWPYFTQDDGMQLIYFESAAVIIGFILLGKYLEELSKFKTTNAIKSLYDLSMKFANRIKSDGSVEVISIDELDLRDIILVKAGEKVPVDGKIVFGSGTLDESFLTGESIPVEKNVDHEVFAGTILKSGSIQVLTVRAGVDTKLQHVIKLVQQAMGSKASAQKLADGIAAVFVPIVLLFALVTGVGWYFFGGDQYGLAFVNTFNVLIIACPCALGLATPMAIMVGIGRAAKVGILVKDAEALQVAKDVNYLFLDKTGTISEGNLSVEMEQLYFPEEQRLELLSILYSLENSSFHPVAEAICRYLESNYNLFPFPITQIETLPGVGLKASIGDNTYKIVPLDYKEVILSGDQIALIKRTVQGGGTGIMFLRNEVLLATYALSDAVKTGFSDLVGQLKTMNLKLEILSGDNEEAVAKVAYEAGIDAYQFRLMPEQKAEVVRKNKVLGKVAFAGDGINDAPSLAEADLGIAMGTGADVAMNTAGVTISSGKLEKLIQLFKLSKATNAIMKQNLFWAFLYNVLAIPVAAGLLYPFTGYLMNPMLAGLAMAISSVSVVLNSMRLNWV